MKLRIHLTRDARGSTVTDAETGHEFERLTAIEVRAAMGEPTTVVLTMLAEVEIEADGDVQTKVGGAT
jgi:hypothetical protein